MDDNISIPISLVAQWAFCPRRAWLEAVGERTDSYAMQVGFDAHRNIDDPSTASKAEIRSLDIGSVELGVVGRVDCLKMGANSSLVEYKATPFKNKPCVTYANRIQLALEGLCLREMGHEVSAFQVFFTSHHKYVDVALSEDDYRCARDAVSRTRETIMAAAAPLPLEDDPRCSSCSHIAICLPDERKLGKVRRSIHVSNPDCRVVHLATPGSYARCSKEQMVVEKNGVVLAKVPLNQVQALIVHGNVNTSGALLRELLWRDLIAMWCSGSGRLVGWSVSSYGPNGQQRVDQHVASHNGRLDIAQEIITAKIANQATQLRRSGAPADVIKKLRGLQKDAVNAERLQDILGFEGAAASIYFGHWPYLLKEDKRDFWCWSGRTGRPAQNSISALLNYSYGLLLADISRALIACGLDPHAGFIHSSKRNKPALALDLMEEFRAPLSDSVVQTVINNGEIGPSDFVEIEGAVRMREGVAKKLIAAYERRVESSFKHPIFGYSVTWRRAMELQARQILGVIDGSQPAYRGIKTR